MGKATVTGGGAAGLYSVQLDLGAARKAAGVAKFNQLIAQLDGRIARQQVKFDQEKAREDQLRDALDAAITAYAEAAAADPTSTETKQASEVVQRAQEALVEQVSKTAEVRVPLQLMKAERAGLQTKLQAMQAVEAQRNANAWCVDLTEDAAGEVATIEVPGEPQQLLIAPGGRAPAADDGFLLARGVMSPEQAFFNAAILPGWQKWKPDYRTGTITALDKVANRAAVQLDALSSSAQGLEVNRVNALTDVPVSYMTCNAQAFEVGDRVVVQFAGGNWDAPTVIGFVSNPKACLPRYVYFPIRHYMLDWNLVGLNAVSVFNILSNGQAGCDPVVVCGADSPFRILQRSEGHFQHSFEYRDGAFFSSSMDGLWVDESAFVLAQVAQGMAVAMYPSTGGVAYLSRDYPRAFNISIGASGAYVQRFTYPNSEMTLPGVQWTAGSSDPCSLHDYATAVVHAGLTVNSSLVGLSSSNEVLVDTANAETFWAWLQSIGAAAPETVTVAGASGTWEYEEPLLVMDPALSSRVLLRYTRPGA